MMPHCRSLSAKKRRLARALLHGFVEPTPGPTCASEKSKGQSLVAPEERRFATSAAKGAPSPAWKKCICPVSLSNHHSWADDADDDSGIAFDPWAGSKISLPKVEAPVEDAWRSYKKPVAPPSCPLRRETDIFRPSTEHRSNIDTIFVMQGLIDCQNNTIATLARHMETLMCSPHLAAPGGASQTECFGARIEALDKRSSELERDFSMA